MAITNTKDLLRNASSAPLLFVDAVRGLSQQIKEVSETSALQRVDGTFLTVDKICLFNYSILFNKILSVVSENRAFFSKYNIVTYKASEETDLICIDDNDQEQYCDCLIVDKSNREVDPSDIELPGVEEIVAAFKDCLQRIKFSTYPINLSHNLPSIKGSHFVEKLPYLASEAVIFPLGRSAKNIGYTKGTYLKPESYFFNDPSELYDYSFTTALAPNSTLLNPVAKWPEGYEDRIPTLFQGSRTTSNQKANICTEIIGGNPDTSENPLNAEDCRIVPLPKNRTVALRLMGNLEASKMYTLSFYARVLVNTEDKQASTSLRVGTTTFIPENYGILSSSQDNKNKIVPDWHRYYVTFISPENLTSLELRFEEASVDIQIKVAGILLEEASKPSAYDSRYCKLGTTLPEKIVYSPLPLTTYLDQYVLTLRDSWLITYKKYIEDATFITDHVDSLNDLSWGILKDDDNKYYWKVAFNKSTGEEKYLTEIISENERCLRDKWLTIFIRYKNNNLIATLYDNCTKLAEISVAADNPARKEGYSYSHCFHSDNPSAPTGNNYYRRLPYSLLLGGLSVGEDVEGPVSSSSTKYLRYSHLENISEDIYRDLVISGYIEDLDSFQRSVLSNTLLGETDLEDTMRMSFLQESLWDTKTLFRSII